MSKEKERIINYNKWLYGPGPVNRQPKPGGGLFSYYARLPPERGFIMMGLHGMILAFTFAYAYKVTVSDPYIKAIKDYYKENPGIE